MDEIQFSAADIRVFLAKHLPYYEAEDKDDFLYIARGSDIERVALALYRHLTSQSSQPSSNKPELIELIKEYGRLMYEAGLREKEDDYIEAINKADELLNRIDLGGSLPNSSTSTPN